MTTVQEKFWQSRFGDDYIDRNTFSPENLDRLYLHRYGTTRRAMFEEFLANHPIETALEVGCNTGNQLAALLAWRPDIHLTGAEINRRAIGEAKTRLPQAAIVEGGALNLPFADGGFDLVFTAGVLIHIAPGDLPQALAEICRVSRRYVMGLEYYAPAPTSISYRGHQNRLWKNDFAALYQKLLPDLKLVKEIRYPHQDKSGNIDSSFLLEKP